MCLIDPYPGFEEIEYRRELERQERLRKVREDFKAEKQRGKFPQKQPSREVREYIERIKMNERDFPCSGRVQE